MLIDIFKACHQSSWSTLRLVVFLVLLGSVALVWQTSVAGFQTTSVLQGRVVNEADQPQTGATVSISMEGVAVQTLLTSTDGMFTVNLPHAGQCNVNINLDGFRTQDEAVVVNKDETVFRSFKLIPSSLHVVVLDNLRERVSDAVVTLKGEDGAVKRAIEAPKGEYYFGRLKPGIHQLTVLMPGFEITVDEGIYLASDNSTMLRTVLLQRASAIPLGDKLKDRYTMPQLPSNSVQTIWQDQLSGAIWLGTSRGLARFNGSEFQSSDSSETYLGALAGQELRTIFQDSRGWLWCATKNNLRIKKPDARTFEAFPLLSGRVINAITEDRFGAIWLATDQGLIHYANDIVLEYTTKQGLPSDNVRCVATNSKKDTIWVGTAQGAVRIEGGIVKPLINKDSAANWPTNFILVDRQGGTWFLTDEGLKHLANETITSVQKDGLMRALKMGVEDRVGNLWLVTGDQKVYIYDLKRDDVDDQMPLDRVLTIMSDQEGNIWFGTENGAVRQDFYSFVNFNTGRGLLDTNINCLLPDSNLAGALWVGSSAGLIYYNGVSFKRVVEIPSNVAVRHLLQQARGVLWAATSDGLYRLIAGRWVRFSTAQGLASDDIRYLCADTQDDSLWVATKKGVSHLDTILAEKTYPAVIVPDPLKITAEVRHIYRQNTGILWFATDRGVYRYDPITYDLTVIGQTEGLESIDVRWIESEADSNVLWFATAKGIEVCTGQRVSPDKRFSGLTGEAIQCIFRDRDQMVWFGLTDGKIKKYLNPKLPAIPPILNTYTREREGLAGNEIRYITQDSTGAIWFATEAGLTRHIPSQAVAKVEYRTEVDGAEATNLNLEAGRHNIKFRFVGVSTLGGVDFIYRMIVNGKEREYRLVTYQSGSREAMFNDLPDGEHVFEILAFNRDLYGLNVSPVRITVHIDKPFWQKTWFYIFISLGFTSAGFITLAIRRHQRREYILPPHLRTFIPIDSNPYIVGNPVRIPAMFFGRQDEFDYLKSKLAGAAQGGVVMVFCGERRAGKSSILYQILNGRLGKHYIPVFIDLQEMVVSNDHEFFGRMARLIAEAVAEANESLERSTDRSLGTKEGTEFSFSNRTQNPYHLFVDFLNKTLSEIGERRLILLIDEYELLENKVEDGKLSKEIFTFLAGLIDNRERLSYVFTGSRRLEERDRRYWRELLRRSFFRKVSFLSEGDTKRLILDPVKDKLVYGRGVIDSIYRLTAGQPFYTQYLCQSIVDHLNEWRRNYLLKADLKQIIDETIDNPLPQMIYFWDAFSDDEKLVMSLLSEVLTDTEQSATAPQIAQAIEREKYPVTLSVDTIRLTLEELFRNDVLKKIGDEAFCFRIDLLRLWIKKSHSIWRVVREIRSL